MSMTKEEALQQATSHQVHLIIPEHVNHYQTLHGGNALNWMDEVAFVTATRFTRQKFMTVGMEKTSFFAPIPTGCIAEVVGEVESFGKSSVKVKVSIFIESMESKGQTLAVEGFVTMVAVNEAKKSIPLALPF